MPRLFVAADLPLKVREKIKNISHGFVGARWTPIEQLHVTLRFIGDVPESTMERLSEYLERVDNEQIDFSLKGVGCFPTRKRPRVIWVGVRDHEGGLEALHKEVEQSVQAAGFEPEKRGFHPHITIARFRNGIEPSTLVPFLQQNALFESEPIDVTCFHLYSSKLTRNGAVHTKERTYSLTDRI